MFPIEMRVVSIFSQQSAVFEFDVSKYIWERKLFFSHEYSET